AFDWTPRSGKAPEDWRTPRRCRALQRASWVHGRNAHAEADGAYARNRFSVDKHHLVREEKHLRESFQRRQPRNVRRLSGEKSLAQVNFGWKCGALQDDPIKSPDLALGAIGSFNLRTLGDVPCLFNHKRAVHQEKCLLRNGGLESPLAACVGVGKIE